MAGTFLMADMGGTNVRFALYNGKKNGKITHYKCVDFATFSDVLGAYQREVGKLPKNFVLAVPGPVGGDDYSFVNNPWHFSISGLKQDFGFEKIHIVNDFEAAAMAIPYLLHKNDLKWLGTHRDADLTAPRIIMGAGTGLGVGILVPIGEGRFKTIASEGGHVCVADTSPEEEKIINYVFEQYGRVSAERLISGQGLSNLYAARTGQEKTSEEIVSAALAGDARARQTVLQMFAFWGDVAGDLALMLGAKGGVYLSGGLVQIDGMYGLLKESDFRNRFEAKGRRQGFLKSIPTFAIMKKDTAFLGLEAFGLQEFKKK